jgi:hypothetical protein
MHSENEKPAERPASRPDDDPGDVTPPPVPVRPEPPAEEVEMGGEAPCQLPRFWDVEE